MTATKKPALNTQTPKNKNVFGAKITTIDLMDKKKSGESPVKRISQQRRSVNRSEKDVKKMGINGKKPIGTLGRINDRDQVKALRNPAKFNAQTSRRSTGRNYEMKNEIGINVSN